jgi:hypothetical protein
MSGGMSLYPLSGSWRANPPVEKHFTWNRRGFCVRRRRCPSRQKYRSLTLMVLYTDQLAKPTSPHPGGFCPRHRDRLGHRPFWRSRKRRDHRPGTGSVRRTDGQSRLCSRAQPLGQGHCHHCRPRSGPLRRRPAWGYRGSMARFSSSMRPRAGSWRNSASKKAYPRRRQKMASCASCAGWSHQRTSDNASVRPICKRSSPT